MEWENETKPKTSMCGLIPTFFDFLLKCILVIKSYSASFPLFRIHVDLKYDTLALCHKNSTYRHRILIQKKQF
jgi:hypothetical protein